MKDIILLGGGGHCKSLIDVIESEGKFHIAGIVDTKELRGTSVLGYTIFASDEDLKHLRQKYTYALVSVGHIKSNSIRVKLYKQLKALGFILPTIISPLAYVSKYSTIKEGSVIFHHAIINAGASVGSNTIINSKALVEHDAKVEDHVHISTGAIINGGATIEENTFFGSGAIIKEYSTARGFIKAGSVVK